MLKWLTPITESFVINRPGKDPINTGNSTMTINNSNSPFTYSPECIAYSTFRKEWRESYKKLSQDIRDEKGEIRKHYSENKPTLAAYAQSNRESLRKTAREMNKELAEAKIVWKALLDSGHLYRFPTSAAQAAE